MRFLGPAVAFPSLIEDLSSSLAGLTKSNEILQARAYAVSFSA